MVVVSIFRWLLNLSWKEKMKIYRYEADTALSKTLAADYQHRRLPPKWRLAIITPDNIVHGAKMGPTWVLLAPHGPMSAPWTMLSGTSPITQWWVIRLWKLPACAYSIKPFQTFFQTIHKGVISKLLTLAVDSQSLCHIYISDLLSLRSP